MLKHLNMPSFSPRRVGVIGANGFVGRALSLLLEAAGTPVVRIARPEVDLLDPGCVGLLTRLLEPADAVVLAAALTPEKGRDAGTLAKNLRMAEHVAAALAAQPCSHLIYLSSDAVYGGGPSDVSEATPAAPADLYGLMHLAREFVLGEAASRAGIPYCVLRPCAIYGSGDTHNSYGPNRFIRSAFAEGRIKIFGAGEETRDHLYIDDACSLARLALQHRSMGTLNLVSGQAVSFGWLASEVARLANRPVEIERLPRGGPVTHRRYDAAAMSEAFPGHRPTLPTEGIPMAMGAFRGAASMG